MEFYDWRENTESNYEDLDNETYTTTLFGQKAIEILDEIGDNDDDTPFTLTVAFEAPHSPTHWAPNF